MAVINFPEGQGSIGRSVFQKLRELKHMHEVAWSEDFRYKTPEEYTEGDKTAVANAEAEGRDFTPIRTRKDRGQALNKQKANTIADMAAVLAGQGKGNKVLQKTEGDKKGSEAEEGKLTEVTVSWSNEHDRNYAMEWSANVSHELFSEAAEKMDAEAEVLEREITGAQPA